MTDRRWWDAAVAAAASLVIIAMVLGMSPADGLDIVMASSALAVLALAYVFIARPALRAPRRWHQPAFVAVAAVTLAVGCATEPFFAVMQAIAYPLAWVLVDTLRRAIGGSVAIAAGVFVGFALFADATDPASTVPALASAAATAGFSLAFAIAFGLWISRIIAYGEERARLLAELTAAQSEVEALSRERGAARERERLARDIHDTLAQTLAGLTILSERAGTQLADGRADVAAQTITTVTRLSRDALDEARALVARTATVPGDTAQGDAALGDAVERLVDRFRAEVGMTIDLTMDVSAGIPRDGQLVVLRCLQESLSNVRKHAQATRVVVRAVTASDGSARVEIEDDGRGFDPLARDPARHEGFGVEGMAERVALAGGEFDIVSRPGEGTTVIVDLPPLRVDAAGVS